jgi:AraC family transcriptional regulator
MPAHNGQAMTPATDSPPHTPVRYLNLLARAKAHIGAHLEGDLSRRRAAPRRLSTRLAGGTGTPVPDYVTWRRLRQACELLAGGERAVLEVALAVGYDSAQALAKAMRRELDTTPSAVRSGQAAPHWQRLFDRRNAPATPTLQETPCSNPN